MSGLAIVGGGWTITGVATTSTNIAGGAANQIVYQTAASTTGFITAPSVANTFLKWDGAAFVWSSTATDITVGTTTVTGGTSGRVLYDNAGTLGEMTNTGSGTVNVLQTAPSLITPVLGVATGTSLALGGATLGTNALAVTGTVTSSGNIVISSSMTFDTSSQINFGQPTALTRLRSISGGLLIIVDAPSGNAATLNVTTVNGSVLISGAGNYFASNNAAFAASSKTTLTNGAGVATGTLLTAPSAGNPTKWIGIDDNGTTRYVPAW